MQCLLVAQAAIYKEAGELQKAIDKYLRAAESSTDVPSFTDSSKEELYVMAADLQASSGQTAEAIKNYDIARGIYEKNADADAAAKVQARIDELRKRPR